MNNTRSSDAEPSPGVNPLDLIRLITPDRLEEIYRHSLAAYPRECCGMILASGTVRRCENAQDKLHQLDPNEFPRTSLNAYCFDVEDQLFLCRSIESDDPVRIVYHSHPDGPPEFSETDRICATMDGAALYPGLGFLVVQCSKTQAGPARLFTSSPESPRDSVSWIKHEL